MANDDDDRAIFNWYWGVEDADGRPRLALDFAYRDGEKISLFDFAPFSAKPWPTLGPKRSGTFIEKTTAWHNDGTEFVQADAQADAKPVDEETAVACLLSLPGLSKYEEAILALRNNIQQWKAQGADLQRRTRRLHVAVHSKDDRIAKDFAEHYNHLLHAAGVLANDHEPVKVVERPRYGIPNHGCCVVLNGLNWREKSTRIVQEAMQRPNMVIVASYAGVGAEKAGKNNGPALPFEKLPFALELVVEDEEETDNPVMGIQERMAAWLEGEYSREMNFEGGVYGYWTAIFAKRIIARFEDKDELDRQTLLYKELDDVVGRQSARLQAYHNDSKRPADDLVNVFSFTREDLLGKEPDVGVADSGARRELEDMIGLEKVKESVAAFATQILNDHYRALEDLPPLRSGLSRVFIGPSGTGKTTVGKLYGRILGDLGLLGPGGFVFKKASEFIGQYKGESETKTRGILEETKGMVLMIDEAYNLDPTQHTSAGGVDSYRLGVINTIVEEVQNTAEENRCVILAGYKDKIEHMIQHANPGLARRFPLSNAFEFEEFSTEQLEKVLLQQMRKRQVTMTEDAQKVAVDMLVLNKQRQNFGNGGDVSTLLDTAQINYTARFSSMTADQRRQMRGTCFLPEDINPIEAMKSDIRSQVEKIFEGLAGVDQVKERMLLMVDRADRLRGLGYDAAQYIPYHLVLKGPSGTGKRTFARKIGWLYQSQRLLATKDVIWTSVPKLIDNRTATDYHGKMKSFKDVLEDATGRVLVIDEAHRLFGDDNEQTNMMIRNLREEISDALSLSRFNHRVVVVLVGLEMKLDRTLEQNPGLANKFTERLQFNGIESGACMAALQSRLEKSDAVVELTSEDTDDITRIFEILARSAEWQNHRDLHQISQELIGQSLDDGQMSEHFQPLTTGSQVLYCLKRKFSRQLTVQRPPMRARSATRGTPDTASLDVPARQRRRKSAEPGVETRPQSIVSTAGDAPQSPVAAQTHSLSAINLYPPAQLHKVEVDHVPQSPVAAQTSSFSASSLYPPAQPHKVELDEEPLIALEPKLPPPGESSSPPDNDDDVEDFYRVRPVRTPTKPRSPHRNDQTSSTPEEDFPVEPYQYNILQDGGYIRLLQLLPSGHASDRLVCNVSEFCLNAAAEWWDNFDALSYTWDTQERTRPIVCDGKTLLITRSCEAAMRRLRREDSTKTLWIDAICINQVSNDDRNQQVALMGDIYRAAECVYVWLGEDLGLDEAILADLHELCTVEIGFEQFEVNRNHFTAINALMKHRWWIRMWTFQEFVLAQRPIFVIGDMRIEWNNFGAVIMSLINNASMRSSKDRTAWLKAAKNTIMNQILPDGNVPAEMQAQIHMLPTWLEVTDVFVCRAAYTLGQLMSEESRHLYMSHYLLKTRNRQASDPRDNIYGLYYLFRTSGFKLPPVNYKLSVTEVYRGAAQALLEQSKSWWILNQLLNKREDSNLALPSWVPDFGSCTVWHKGIDLRFHNIRKMTQLLENEVQTVYHAEAPFLLKQIPGGLLTQGDFLWTIARKTDVMRPHPILDRAFEETFETTEHRIVDDALEEFFVNMSDWLRYLEPKPDLSQGYMAALCEKEEMEKLENQVLDAIACAYWRGSWKFIRSFGKPIFNAPRGHEEMTDDDLDELPDALSQEACRFLRLFLARIRSCMSPDARHPCRCGRIDTHEGVEAGQCLEQWVLSQGVEELKYVKYWLYSRAIDHAIFQTKAVQGCAGHFGFCRNGPREGDDVVLLPGLSDPVVVRRRGKDTYRVVGVTTGLLGPPVLDSSGNEVEGGFCLGTCRRLADPNCRQVRNMMIC